MAPDGDGARESGEGDVAQVDAAGDVGGDGGRNSEGASGFWEMVQFWQLRHARLHPAVAIEKAVVPGRKWYRGFFSTGSVFTAHGLPKAIV